MIVTSKPAIAAICIAALCAATPALAHKTHRHHATATAARMVAEAPPKAAPVRGTPGNSFYPEEIEGGVSGNLAFNNQIRKLKDPLNANGAGR